MRVQIFNIPLADKGELLEEMNRFLAKYKDAEVEQQFFQNENGGLWSFCIKYTHDSDREGIDYRKILSDSELIVFDKLREIRLALAREDGVPPYMVFHNKELAGMAQLPELTEDALLTISGFS